MWQKFFNPFDGIFGYASEDIAEPGKRSDPPQFARGDEAAQHGRGLSAVIAPEEGPVVTTPAKRRSDLSAALLSVGRSPSEQYRVSAAQFFNVQAMACPAWLLGSTSSRIVSRYSWS